jgi:hypothetical protein
MQDYDDQIESVLAGTWTQINLSGINIAADVSGTYTRASGSFITDGYRVGDWVAGTGFTNAGNNTTARRVIGVTATVLTVDVTSGPAMVTEASAAGRTLGLVGRRVQIGTALRTWTIERQFVDVSRFQPFRGVALNSMKLSIQPDQLVQGEFGLLGMSGAAVAASSITASALTPLADTSPFTAFSGSVVRGSTQVAVATGIDLNIDNGRKLQAVVGGTTSPDVFEGTADVTGTLSMMFNGLTDINDFLNENRAGLYLRLLDQDGTSFHSINMPLITFTGGEINPPNEGPCILQLPFRALTSVVNGQPMPSLSWQRSN